MEDGSFAVTSPAPAPWHHILSGSHFGTLVCETGILHSFWDNSVFETNLPKSFGDLAYLADNADKKGIKEITEGDVFDWAGRTAEKCWPLNNTWHDGDTLPSTYATEMRTTLLEQLRDAGYRLAKVLNETFK